MASLIDELIDVLNRENTEYEALLELSTQKTSVIVKDDIASLNDMMAKEQKHLDSIVNLENKRIETTKDIAIVLNMDVNTLTVKGIADLLVNQKDEYNRLIMAHDRLKNTLDKVNNVNEINKGLINEALELIEFNINYLNGFAQIPVTANYTRDAYNQGQEGIATFDAKN